ncbi:ABC transporter permease [Tenacibaculum jejuense]|uniref:ABC transporter, ATP-binding and permease protein n=1 Tax=Tenacibaculum jejuense TaxID=584609 RepID=A0A238UBE4_9FLAO|nr:ABC transporter permease [Tenacibaculum jejuense]SNR16395.1 ABC transporter, ATP-binding and permease protein [Tenacibaculum jejuense]
MFDIDSWREIFQSINKNKLRTVLSGFTISFAILLFTLLFGIVNGLQNFFTQAFVDDANNSMFVRVWKTTKPYKGLQSGRRIKLKNKDLDYIVENYSDKIQYISARKYLSAQVVYKNNQDNYNIRAVHPDHRYLEKTIIDEGRFINQLDLNQNNKVIVIGRLVKKDLFGERIALGKYVNVNNISYKIVGVFSDEGGDREERNIYMPITTAQKLYGNNDFIDNILIGYNPRLTIDRALAFGNGLERDLKQRLDIHPDDQSALFIRNMAEANKGVGQLTTALFFIVIFVGSGTLIAGIIGISNIMIFSIKERTKEFGIRKALGAKPVSIIAMVVKESLLITGLAGYFGLLLGTFILDQIGDGLEKYFIYNPSVSTGIVVGATIILILAGLLAGYLPAKRAAQIKPIVALRAD